MTYAWVRWDGVEWRWRGMLRPYETNFTAICHPRGTYMTVERKWIEGMQNGEMTHSVDIGLIRWTVWHPVPAWELAQACVEVDTDPEPVFEAFDDKGFLVWDDA